MLINLVFLLGMFMETFTFQWTSSTTFPNGTRVNACLGDNVTFPWTYDVLSSERVIDIEWYQVFQNREIPVAAYIGDRFLAYSDMENKLHYVPKAGLLITGVTPSDMGLYFVRINLNGIDQTTSQTAVLHEPDAPVTTSGRLQTYILSTTLFPVINGESHLQLGCGNFTTLGESPISVTWMTPSGQYRSSTYNNGVFVLTLPNPLEGGNYTCQLNELSTTQRCLLDNPLFHTTSTVYVDGITMTLLLLRNDINWLREDNIRQTEDIARLSELLSAFQDKITFRTITNFRFADDIYDLAENEEELVQLVENLDWTATAFGMEISAENTKLMANNSGIGNEMMIGDENMEIVNNIKYLGAIVTEEDQTRNSVQDCADNNSNAIEPNSCFQVQVYNNENGIHTIYPNGSPVTVYCDQTTDNGGWTVIQKRQDGSVDFYRNWTEYERGFGNPETEYWIGLANLHSLSSTVNVTLRVDLTDFDGSTAYAVYNTFSIAGPEDNYRLKCGGYNGTAGNSLAFHNNMEFSTFDRDHDTSTRHCALQFQGAWWYSDCYQSNLNGRYFPDAFSSDEGVSWYFWKSDWRSLKRVEMKIKP